MGSSQATAKSWADPEVRARRLAGMAASLDAKREEGVIVRRNCRARGVPVPGWVPESLADEYREIGATLGQEAAAAHCRRLKREMSEPTLAFGRAP